MKVSKYQRGQIWWYRQGGFFEGSIEGKTRPMIILSNDKANENSPILLAVPCTSVDKKEMPTHVNLYIEGTKSIALAENLTSIDKNKIGDYIGILDDEALQEIEKAVKIALGMIPIPVYERTEVSIQKPPTIKEYLEKKEPVKAKRKTYQKMSTEEKRRFLDDYEDYGVEYMKKKYKIKKNDTLYQKVYILRKQFEKE